MAEGGRGKSFTFAKMAAVWGYAEKLRILCTREMQNSIKESFHAELKNAIQSEPWLQDKYDVGVDYIRGKNGTEFIFRGLRHNMSSIKSMAQVDLCIVEEASDIPQASWNALLPTIRSPKSEFWIIYNPRNREDPVDKMFRNEAQPPRSMIVEINHIDNPWFPPELEEQRLYAREVMDDALYRHVWEGDYYEQSDAQVFAGKYEIKEFEPHRKLWSGPYFGIDWGFSQDPTVAIKSWIYQDCLYIEKEAGKIGLETDETASFLLERIPELADYVSRADSARPETISYVSRHGIPRIQAAKKGKGSIEDGIAHIKSFKRVYIHPRCENTLAEFRLYSYKIDRLSGDILPDIIDANNHYIDALRYALEPVLKGRAYDYRSIL